MSNRNFRQMLEKRWEQGSFVCVGLDSELSRIPVSAHRSGNETILDRANTMVAFNEAIIEATHDLVCAYKPNIAFYEQQGEPGLNALFRTIQFIHRIAPEVPVILDAKRADIGNTNTGYARAAFEYLRADAITVNPYFGGEALQPFLDMKDKGIIVLCRTSNPGAGELQNLPMRNGDPLYLHVARQVANHWNKNENCAVVVGATATKELEDVREVVGNMPILIPGIGTQGGDLRETVTAGMDDRWMGMIINSSSGIIFKSSGPDFAAVARQETQALRDSINLYL